MSEHQTHPSEGLTRRAWLAAGGATLLTACTTAGAAPLRGGPSVLHPALAGLDELPRWMRLASVPGVSVGIVARDGVSARGYGVTRAEDGQPVDADTVFEAASLSKPVFAYLVLRLAAEGVIDIDRPLAEYLAIPNASDAPSRSITARHVLSHTTGWRNWRIAREHSLTADFTPGSRFGYSGEGYYFLQRVVERLTGHGTLRLTRERVFGPLGMRRSAYMSRPDLETNRAAPHSNRGVPIDSFNTRVSRGLRESTVAAAKPVEDWTHEDGERAVLSINKDALVLPNFLLPNVAGSLLTTARDYTLFLRHLLGLSGAPAGGRAVLDRMLAPQVTLNEAIRWGLGVGLQTNAAGTPQTFWHWGDSGGVKTFVLADPAAGDAIVVFTNGNSGRAVYERVVRAVRGADQPAFVWI